MRTVRRAAVAGLSVAALTLAAAGPAAAATPGAKDPQFGSAGMVTTDLGRTETARDVLVQSDGKIVVVGSSGPDAAIIRYLPNGNLDATFSGDGVRTVDFGGPADTLEAVAQQPDGKLVAVGTTGDGEAVIARFTTKGALDTTFSANGWAIESASGGAVVNDTGRDVVVLPGGGLAMVGSFRISRWTSTGTQARLLPTAGWDGSEAFRRIGVLSTGDYVVAGASDCNSAVITKVTSGGTDDMTFRGNSSPWVGVRAVALQVRPKDKILVVSDGEQSPECTYRPGVVFERYLPDGHHDTTFGSGGAKVVHTDTWPAAARNVPATGASVMTDGRIVVVGRTWVARFTASGALDTTFAGDGIAVFGGAVGAAAAVQGNSNPVVAATASGDLAAVRFLGTDTVTAYPAGTTVLKGTRVTGTANSLAATDGTYLKVASTTTGTRTGSWYGRFDGVPNAVSAISVSYRGKASRTVTQTVSLWDWDAGGWVRLDSRSVGTTAVTVKATAPGGLARFVSGASGSGAVRLRVRATSTTGFSLSGDRMALAYR